MSNYSPQEENVGFGRLRDVPSVRDLTLIASYSDDNGVYDNSIGEEAVRRSKVDGLSRESSEDIFEAAIYASNLGENFDDIQEVVGKEYAIRHPDYVHENQIVSTSDLNILREDNVRTIEGGLERAYTMITEKDYYSGDLIDPAELTDDLVFRSEGERPRVLVYPKHIGIKGYPNSDR